MGIYSSKRNLIKNFYIEYNEKNLLKVIYKIIIES